MLNQALLVPHCTQSGHEPAVAVATLAHIGRSRAIDKEAGLLEYLLLNISQHPQSSGKTNKP